MDQKFNYGGQAVLEGVMMRGSHNMAVAVRTPDGNIVIHEQPITSSLYNGFWSKVPFVRGLGMLWDSLGLGMRALTFSADVAVGDEAEFSGPVAWGTILVAILLAVGLFFLTPRLAADAIQAGLRLVDGAPSAISSPAESMPEEIGDVPASSNSSEPQQLAMLSPDSALVGNLIEGVVRLFLVVGYIWLVGRIPDIRRVFAYHGAEHKTINAYEDNVPLTPEEVARYSVAHARCGTGFLLIVVVISVLVFSLLGDPPVLIRYLSRIVLVPVIAAVSYEYMRFMARNLQNPVARALVVPQLALQKLTTREPSLDMLEVSIAALQRVLAAEKLPVAAVEAVPVEDR
ncbi:MAG: DUF1385 domain-containing protein [Anaerolineae bacterium]|nr:DUF1385 domain-containing protein [Anaerolineae bacterium]